MDQGERGEFVGGMESISKLQATLFDPLSPPPTLRILTPSRGLFPAPSLRKSHSLCSTHTARLALYLFGSLPFGRQRARLEY